LSRFFKQWKFQELSDDPTNTFKLVFGLTNMINWGRFDVERYNYTLNNRDIRIAEKTDYYYR